MKLRIKLVQRGGESWMRGYLDDILVSSLTWDTESGRIQGVWTEPDHRGQGIATALYEHAQGETGGRLMHSAYRTTQGDAWARKVGGVIPPLAY